MLPSILARQYQEGLIDYIDTTFPITNPIFKDSLSNMLQTKGSVFHEPYVSVRLPFRVYEGDDNPVESIDLPFAPYVHQYKAYKRLAVEDRQSTLIATGTGSGKTECFLYPILDYCCKHPGEGIKALIIYPMNALASDQAKRIAEAIHDNPKLKSAGIRVGMYVGGIEKTSAKMMMPDHVITDKETLLAAPPDILMTNYKMLDYLLVRPKDAELWNKNTPDTLKYIAVDELHTFDGAQGTDLACLLRRLKARLNILPGQLCCIGTSATMGSETSSDSIRKYAADIFGEDFEEGSVITEDRLSPIEFFAENDVEDFSFPSKAQIEDLIILSQGIDENFYLEKAAESWFDNFSYDEIDSKTTRVDLGHRLMKHNFTQSIIHEAKGSYVQSKGLIDSLGKRFPQLFEYGTECAVAAIDSLYALISHARIITETGHLRPFLNVQVQVWMRELRRLVGKVSDRDITYALSSDLNEHQAKHYLPVVNCRECGETGWASIDDNGSVELRDIRAFYNLFFDGDSKVRIMFPYKKEEKTIPAPYNLKLCPECMEISFDDGGNLCSNGHETIPVWVPDIKTQGRSHAKSYPCPCCGSKSNLSIIGLRSATAISAGISELYASKFNDDKKLLAFTDNVQDAAHHAGFYNSRTWKFGLRSAVIQYLNQIDKDNITLIELADEVVDYWKTQFGIEKYISFFVPESMTWMRAYKKMLETGTLTNNEDTKNLIWNVDQRVKYEILLEYGISSRRGRTLEKSGCSVLSFNINSVVDRIRERIVNEVGVLQDTSSEKFYQIILGVLYEMKTNGAISHSVYNSFINEGGVEFLLGRIKWMPRQRKGINVPKFIAINKGGKKLGYFEVPDKKSSYGKWIDKFLPDVKMESSYRDITIIILEELSKEGVLIKHETKDDVHVWGINSDNVAVTKNVSQLICNKCGNKLSMSSVNAEKFEGACCTRPGCEGTFVINNDEKLDFYSKLYANGEMVRVVAKEHTGLLQRDDRETLEKNFKKSKEDKSPWEANLLSCTPTLEMGIDIGDLSTVILCSIPPAQAQYAQRAGRGGRKDGNALTIAVANSKPHDLYFYEDPMEMIAGDVEPPKVFLKASAVLSRQFTAFCMDCWVKDGGALVPKDVGACLAKLDEVGADRFPNNFMTYVQTNLSKLVRTFINTFSSNPGGSGGLDENAIADIKRFALGDRTTEESMAFKIDHEFRDLKEQRKTIRDNIKALDQLIKDIESKPQDSSFDEQISELKAERSAWRKVVEGINTKDVFGFLSDSGLLPNYAFPEAGIILKAVLTRAETEEETGKRKYNSTSYEYTRAASAAISELAPLNSFYAGGHKLTIDQVDINTAKVEKWRLCPNCSHAELENSGRKTSTCPQCGSPGWADAGQVRSLFKVAMVYSTMREQDSIIGDDSDDRTTIFYDKELHVEVDEDKDVLQAFQMDNEEFSFGYEFVKNTTMREINFGETSIVGDKLAVAGREGIRKGFKICKYCGKIQIEGKAPQHSKFCRIVKDINAAMDPYEECLFLYREFQTEALRLLIPATTMDSTNVRVESFVAAFMLGMKSYFGNVDHLNATVSEVPVPNADYRKQYLVIYDTVPGGTGYLKQLMNDTNGIVDILQRSLDIMEGCSCKDDPQKDGCYKCLYAYRQSHHIGEISRRTAIGLLKAILSGKENKKEIKKLAYVDVNHLFDSELERRFVGAFERLSTAERPIHVHKQLVNEKEGYSLQIGDALWSIEPQVDFDNSMGIAVKSRPDFVIRPKRVLGNQKPVAVFTDGYHFHNESVDEDTRKRMAIMLSGKYRVWSLTYKDVQHMYQDQGDYRTETLIPDKMPFGTDVYRPIVKKANATAIRPEKSNSFELLVEYLSHKEAEAMFKGHALAYAMALIDRSSITNQILYDEWKQGWESILTAISSEKDPDAFHTAVSGKWMPRKDLGNIEVYSEVSMTDMQIGGNLIPAKVGVIINDDTGSRTEKYEQDWNGFWNYVNVMQFNETAYFLSRKGMMDAIYTVLGTISADEEPIQAASSTTVAIDSKWDDIMDEFFDDVASTCATEMKNNGVSAPSTVGFELDGNAEAEMAWEDRQIVWLLPDQEIYMDIFKDAGWKVLLSSEEVNISTFGGA